MMRSHLNIQGTRSGLRRRPLLGWLLCLVLLSALPLPTRAWTAPACSRTGSQSPRCTRCAGSQIAHPGLPAVTVAVARARPARPVPHDPVPSDLAAASITPALDGIARPCDRPARSLYPLGDAPAPYSGRAPPLLFHL